MLTLPRHLRDTVLGVFLFTFIFAAKADQPPVNDQFENRIHLSGSSLSVTGSTVFATKQVGEPSELSGIGSVWWAWQAPGPGAVKIWFSGNVPWSSSDGLYTGSTLETLVPVRRVWDPTGQTAIFDVSPGTEYQIGFDSYHETDSLVMRVEFFPAPENDLFENRSVLSGTNFTVTNSNLGASKEIGEPLHPYTEPGGHSLWWSWTAPVEGNVHIFVEAYFSPLVAVYTGDALSNLVLVAAADNGVDFPTKAGATYQISVDGQLYRIDEDFFLSLEVRIPPPNDHFTNRFHLAGPIVTTNGHNREATAELDEPSHQQYRSADNSIWWSWTAPASGPVTIEGTSPSMPVAVAVYTGTTLNTLNRVTNRVSQVTFQATSGQTYAIATEGTQGMVGDITLSLAGTLPPYIETGSARLLNDGRLQLRILGQVEQNFAIHASSDLQVWTNLGIHSLTSTNYDFTDEGATNFSQRFYRLTPPPGGERH